MKTKIFLTVAVGLSLCMASGCDPPTAQERAARNTELAAEWAPEEAKQLARDELIEKLIAANAFEKVEYHKCGATLWVGLTFFAGLTFDDKQTFCNVVLLRASTAARSKSAIVTLRDVHSGKAVGRCTQWGLTMD